MFILYTGDLYLDTIYRTYGYYQELLVSKTFPGQGGMESMREFMTGLRNNPPSEIAGIEVEICRDYEKREEKRAGVGETIPIELPKSDVLQYALADDTLISIRPSGTEPKLKFYASACSPVSDNLSDARRIVSTKLEAVRAYLETLTEAM